MKRYIDFEEFKKIIYELPLDEETVFTCEELEYAVYAFHFKHIRFLDKDIVLYDHPQSAAVGIIQDEYYITFDQALEEVWNTLIQDDAKVYIEE